MRVRIAVLTLALALGVAGLASAQESGNWLTRMFSPATKNEPAKNFDLKPDLTNVSQIAAQDREKKASQDLERRREVCLKLIDIANATGDEELRRKAELLDQRAYDLYVAAKNRSRALERVPIEPDVKKGGR